MSLPGEVIFVDGALAVVRTAGVERRCNGLVYPELECGDQVLVHAGLVVRILTREEVREMEAAFADLGILEGR
jgi:hydrogenase maturation factor